MRRTGIPVARILTQLCMGDFRWVMGLPPEQTVTDLPEALCVSSSVFSRLAVNFGDLMTRGPDGDFAAGVLPAGIDRP
jgi:hypothetical protein